MNKVTEQKFVTLRKQLDQLGYRHAFGIDSMPLVNQLFADLLHTTDSLKKAKVNLHKATTPSTNPQLDDILEPYSKDNARLVQENNKLHQHCIDLKEEVAITSKELKARIAKLQHENSDLRFLNNQFAHKVRALENDTASKTDTIQKLQEKNLQAVIQTPGGKRRTIPFRRQHMQIDGPVPPSTASLYVSSQPDDPYIADLLQVADTRIEQLNVEVKKLSEVMYISESKIETLRSQVETRDREIERLNRSLEGGRPHDVLSLEAKNTANERLISHLNLQVDYLQQTNQELEIRVTENENQREELQRSERRHTEEIEQLKMEIRDIDHLALQVEKEKKKAVKVADLEVREVHEELRMSQKQENDLECQLQVLEESKEKLTVENEDLQLKLNSQEQEIDGLGQLINKMKRDKDTMTRQLKNLMTRERELVLEIEDYRLSGTTKSKNKDKNKLDAFLKTIEQERDYYKNECDLLNSMLQKNEKGTGQDPLRSRIKSPGPFSPDRTMTQQLKEYKRIVKERDELQLMLDKFERHMSEIQSNVKILTQERDKTNLLYEKTHQELQKLRREAIRSPTSAKSSLTAQAILRRVENERNMAMDDLRRMTTERDALRERIELHKKQSTCDIVELERKTTDLSERMVTLEAERRDLMSHLTSAKELNISQQEDLKTLRAKLDAVEEERQDTQHRFEDSQTRLLQLESAVENSKNRHCGDLKELEDARDMIDSLQDKITNFIGTVDQQSVEITGLRASLELIDQEKDELQIILDDKTEQLVLMEERLLKRECQISEQKSKLENVEKQLDQATEDLASVTNEAKLLRKQLDTTQSQLMEALQSRDVGYRENSRIQDDLATLTRENQDLNMELDDTLHERETGREKIKEYIVKIANLEGDLASKEREMNDLLEQYRKVSVDRDDAESKYRVLVDETQALKLEIMSVHSEKTRYADKATMLEQELKEHLQSQQIYENNIADLTAGIQRLEGDIHRANEERTLVTVDLSSARDLNAKLDIGKEQTMRQLASKNVEYEQLKLRHDEVVNEISALERQFDDERMEKKNLEALIASSREKEYEAQMSFQELTEKFENLQEQFSLLEGKCAHQTREVTTLRSKLSQLDADLEITKRQLTNEQYERERAVQELRKHNIPSPGVSRLVSRQSPMQRPRSASPARSSPLDPDA